MSEETQFDEIYEKFKALEGKHDSQYIFVIYDVIVDDVLDRIHKMLGLIDEIKNTNKKYTLKTKLNNFVKHLEGMKSGTIVNSIYLIGDDVHNSPIKQYWRETLTSFSCDNFIVRYDTKFQIDWLKELLLDRSYIHVLNIKNNNLKHSHLNNTKRRAVCEKEEKGMNIITYIQENIPKDDICLIHGISSLIKNISETPKMKILNGSKKDDEILFEYNKLLNDQAGTKLQWWLDRLNDPKEGSKIVFGRDIEKCMTGDELKTLFCSTDMKNKVLKNVKQENRNFEIIEIKSYGEDIGKTLVLSYRGGIGVRYFAPPTH